MAVKDNKLKEQWGKFRPQVFCQSELFRLSSLRVSGQSQSIIFHWCCRGGNIIKNTTHNLNTRHWINLAKMWSSCTVVPASFRQPLLYPFSCDTCRCQHWRCMWILSSFKATFSKSRQDTTVLARHHTNHPLALAVCYSLVFHRLIVSMFQLLQSIFDPMSLFVMRLSEHSIAEVP